MTKTHRITHSTAFERLRARQMPASTTAQRDAEKLLERAREAQMGFEALFASFDDFDELVRECIPTCDDVAAASAPVKRERSAGTRDHAGRRGRSRSRASLTNPGATSSYGHSRR